jgi:hypothetical protein
MHHRARDASRRLARGAGAGELGGVRFPIPSPFSRAVVVHPAVQPRAPEPPPTAGAEPREGGSCSSCGCAFEGRFCPRCGERRLTTADYSLRAFSREALSTITNLDSTLSRSFAALVGRPGLLTREYLAGRRTRYLRPMQLFVFCNVIFFFVQPLTGFNTLTTPLHVHLHHLPYSPLARQIVDRMVNAKGVSAREYELLFNATIDAQARTLVVAMVPLLALLIAAMHRRRYFVEHLVFSLHFFAFFLLLLPTLAAALWVANATAGALDAGNGVAGERRGDHDHPARPVRRVPVFRAAVHLQTGTPVQRVEGRRAGRGDHGGDPGVPLSPVLHHGAGPVAACAGSRVQSVFKILLRSRPYVISKEAPHRTIGSHESCAPTEKSTVCCWCYVAPLRHWPCPAV